MRGLDAALTFRPGFVEHGGAIRRRWAAVAPDEAARWLSAQKDEVVDLLLPLFATALTNQWKDESPDRLLKLPASENRNHLISAALMAQASRSPQTAVHWALAHSAEAPHAMAAALNAWAEADAASATQFLSSQAPSAARDQGYVGLTDRLSETDAAQSMTLSAAISDASVRTQQQRTLLTNWLAGDREAAEQWIGKDATLSPEFKSEVLASNAEAPGQEAPFAAPALAPAGPRRAPPAGNSP